MARAVRFRLVAPLASPSGVRHAALAPALSLVAGIACGLAGPAVPAAWLVLLVASIVVSVRSYRAGRAVAVLAAVCAGWIAAGALLAQHADRVARDPPIHRFLPQDDEPVLVEGRLWEDAAVSPSGITLMVHLERMTVNGRVHLVDGRAIASMTGDTTDAPMLEWRAGRRIRAPVRLRVPTRYRNPGGPDHRLALARRGVALVGSVKSARLIEVVARGGPLDEACASVRAVVRRLVTVSVVPWSEQSAAITTAILIGDRAGLDDRVTRALQEAGTYHVIAISGGNVAILAGVLLGAARVLVVPWRVSLAATALALVGYAHVASGGSSVARATTMAVVYLVARALDHQGSGASSLGVAATLILCVSPLAVLEPGFLLTFGATAAMLVLVPPVVRAVRLGWVRAPAALLAASVASELALMPVGALFFSRITIAGLLLNFAAVPLMTVVQMGGMLALAAAAVSPAVGVAAGWVPHAAAHALVASASWVEWVPWLTWRVAPPPAWALTAYYGGLAGLLLLWACRPLRAARVGRRLGFGTALLVGAAALCILTAPAFGGPSGRPGLRVLALDVGQGDATLVEVEGRRAVLVDAGGLGGVARFDIGERVVAPALWARGIRSLEALVVTHGDADHAGGAAAVLELFRTREVWEGVPVPAHEPLATLARVAEVRRVPWRTVQAGDRLRLGDLTIDVLHPPLADWERHRIRNNDSVVLELRYGQVSILLPGDIDAEAEHQLAGRLQPSPLRVLKAAHHGSRSSSSAAFVEALGPAVAVISCGQRNLYGHPSREVVARLERAGAHVFRTDQDGAVLVETDGRELLVQTWTGRRLLVTPDGARDLAAVPRRTLRDAIDRWMRVTQGR